MGGLLILFVTACRDKPGTETEDDPLQNDLQLFARAESDRISRAAPPAFALFVGTPAADIDALVGFHVILLTEGGRDARYPEQVTGYGDILPFGLYELAYDPTRHIVTAVYSSFEWSPFAGSKVCPNDQDSRMFEQEWLTEINYLCDCCVQIFVGQSDLENADTQANTPKIGASATIQPMPVGEIMGEFVTGHWAAVAETGQSTTQTLQWTEDGKYGTLRWQECNWLFEIRAKGQDGGFVFADLIPIAQDIHNQVVCQE